MPALGPAVGSYLRTEQIAGNVRSRAVTLGQIPDVFADRGELDEALRIRREDELPVYERLGLARDLAIGRWNLALIRLRRGGAGDREAALALLRAALPQTERMGLPLAERIRSRLEALLEEAMPEKPGSG